MILKFKKIRLVNFGSYLDSTINLQDKGFCIVSGTNNCVQDCANSNGTGKSTIWSGICYALTGETVQGVKKASNIKNLHSPDKDGFVELELLVNSDTFLITRIFSPKTNLIINKNNEDISGKGIVESEKILNELLPDLTKDLIASTIILGQGLPNKFSSFSPSGRKDLLEKLTKSDFMIEDIKTRLQKRKEFLQQQNLEYNNVLLEVQTQLNIFQPQLQTFCMELTNYEQTDYNKELATYAAQIQELSTKSASLLNERNKVTETLNKTVTEFNTKAALRQNAYESENSKFNENYSKLITTKSSTETRMKILDAEIKRLKNVLTICPTCGKPLDNVHKIDTTDKETDLKNLTESFSSINLQINNCKQDHDNKLRTIDTEYQFLSTYQNKTNNLNAQINKLNTEIQKYANDQKSAEINYQKVLQAKNILFSTIEVLKNKISTLTDNIKNLQQVLKDTNNNLLNTKLHLDTVSKIESLIKRDFRGVLLYNILEYLNKVIKKYSKKVFEIEAMEIVLSGNSIDLLCNSKPYEILSGGEKQRVDIIMQFAIRDLLQKCYNFSSNILVLDEITDNLDLKSTTQIFNLITTELKDIESIFIVSHHATELNIPVDSNLYVIKTVDGTSTVQEN